ncbi:hypothetical protein KV201_03685 [Shewanella sp. SR1]|uniref:hypothetical protein n=1 Tax=Shewanella sp. SR1 TaxID=2855505 RepID=UPI001CF42776|nr:hypothetical protein [Shewanella sp. SR1]MCB2381278.1 hypothetical protein [Shewanella sp. SR1]
MKFVGLVKFFRNEEFLDSLLSGCFHCSPPERYRMDEQLGVSDKIESCAYSYRVKRNDPPIVIMINDIEITDPLSLTVHNNPYKDSWMHCWFTLNIPDSEDGLAVLKSDLDRMKKEFGSDYAFIPNSNLNELIHRLKSVSIKDLQYGEVEYSNDSAKFSCRCKSLSYSYQREFRFLFGECAVSEEDFFILNYENGFRDLIYKNATVKLTDRENGHVWFELK